MGQEHRNTDGYKPGTIKFGLIRVEPPFEILERMVTLRVHLDATDEREAPLRIVPGSHRLGRLPETEIGRVGKLLRAAIPLLDRLAESLMGQVSGSVATVTMSISKQESCTPCPDPLEETFIAG